ncbi:putative membrane protein [Cricetibacter osteomyelitidis]|uniref:Putative membrane protein n=1 Tax=Cricetibacter osteomyelitidis TaxID=1521931 RepID=A0A4R2T3V2_9PAST|nr:GDYXXLXY domain-containing protein [Cricetibacter osteomyelitidis]TCP95956.1 putative membrane protein [Cricetibacter osteomyelitidis]
MNQRLLFGLSWQQYLVLLFSLLGTGLFVSGIVTFIAANWDYLSRFQKIYAAQGLFVLITVVSLFFYWREVRQSVSHFKSKSGLFISAVLIGVLFALIGQIYQTGADPWQLFALWSLLQLPLLLVLPNAANGLLWIVTANTVLSLYLHKELNALSSDTLALSALFNILLLCLVEWKIHLFQDKWRVLPKLLVILFAFFAFFAATFASDHDVFDVENGAMSLGYFFNALCAVLLFFMYWKKRPDIGLMVIVYIYGIITIDGWIINNALSSMYADSYSVFLVVAIFTFVAAIIGGEWLKKWFVKNHPDSKLSFSIYGLAFILATLAIGFFLVFLSISAGSETPVLVVSLIFLAAGSVRYFSSSNRHYMDEMLILFGLLLAVTYAFIQQEFYRNSGYFLALTGLSVLCYVLFVVHWLRVVCVSLALFSLFYYLEHLYFDFSFWDGESGLSINGILITNYLRDAVYVATFALAVYCYRKPESAVKFSTVLWGAVIYQLISVTRTFVYMCEYALYIGNGETKTVDSFTALFNVLTNNVFMEREWNVSFVIVVSLMFIPTVVYLFISSKLKYRWLFLIPIALFSAVFIASGYIITLFGLLLIAYALYSRMLFAVITIYMLFALALYYYWLGIPLLYKSLLLLVMSVFFLLTLTVYKLLERKNENSTIKSTALFTTPSWNSVTIAVLATVFAALGIANYAVVDNENVLNNGKPIILKLAPVDPRSLMQGDYMELNYDMLMTAERLHNGHIPTSVVVGIDATLNDESQAGQEREIAKELERQEQEAENTLKNIFPEYGTKEQAADEYYLLLKADENGVNELCRMTYHKPQDFNGCTEDIYLVAKYRDYRMHIPGQQYFFAEGKADYYSKAQYGEYRFKDGKALLLRLLDEQLKPL